MPGAEYARVRFQTDRPGPDILQYALFIGAVLMIAAGAMLVFGSGEAVP